MASRKAATTKDEGLTELPLPDKSRSIKQDERMVDRVAASQSKPTTKLTTLPSKKPIAFRTRAQVAADALKRAAEEQKNELYRSGPTEKARTKPKLAKEHP